MSYESDIAVAPIERGDDGVHRLRARVPERWRVVDGANGGLIAAQATRAMQHAVGDPQRTPRSLTVHYLAAARPGAELEYRALVQRSGRSTSFVSLRVLDGDELIALGLGCLGTWRDDGMTWSPPAPPAPAGEDAEPLDLPLSFPDSPYWTLYELRPLFGDPIGSGSDRALAGGLIRTRDVRPLDHATIAAYSDAWWPAAQPRLREPTFMPTLDLTIHWRAPLPADPHPWVCARWTSTTAAGGMWEENGELWGPDGTLLAHSRQLALLRPVRRHSAWDRDDSRA